MMKIHTTDPEGPPCRHMEGMLQATADGHAGSLTRWYARAHAARCERCGRYLERMEETVCRLREAKAGEPEDAVAERLEAVARRQG